MSDLTPNSSAGNLDALFNRIADILEEARDGVVQSVNTHMVLGYWMIGREIVQHVQGGEERAKYGDRVVEELAERLTKRYGSGFSMRNLHLFKQFYIAFGDRGAIVRPMGAQSGEFTKLRPVGAESPTVEIPFPKDTEWKHPAKDRRAGDGLPRGFSPQLSWSHYRALMRVDNVEARDFYERESVAGGWDKRTLERQIQSFYYERILKTRKPEKMLAEGRKLQIQAHPPIEVLKQPYVLEFLGLPDVAAFHESDLERAIISHLQRFLLELGSGFAFVPRQKHLRIEEQDRYIDLVFYHCRLKFYLLIDLKVDELTHGDVGQMDGYVRMYDGLFVAPDDNPTIGLILCTEKNETVARYSVLSDRKQIFASKYMLFLPTEEQLRMEIEKERRLHEQALEERNHE